MVAARLVFISALAATLAFAASAEARARRGGGDNGGVPELNVKSSCQDAQKFSVTGDNKNNAFAGCMQDEMNAKTDLARRWSSFKPKDRQNCVEQSRDPSPSYVEVLTCLEMDSDAMRNNSRGGAAATQTGGSSANSLPPPSGGNPAPSMTAPPR